MLYMMAICVSVLLLMPAALYILHFIRNPFHPLIFVGIVMCLVGPGSMLLNYHPVLSLITESTALVFVIVTGLSMLGFYGGWLLQKWRSRGDALIHTSEVIEIFDANKLFIWAVVFDVIGLAAYFATREQFTVTGYLREFGTLWVVGAVLSVQAYLLNPSMWGIYLMSLLPALIPPADRFFSYGQRGDTFRLAIVFLPFCFFKKYFPKPKIFVPVAIAFALVMGTLERTRTLIGRGEATGRLDALVKVIPSVFNRNPDRHAAGDETYVYGPAMIQTVRDTNSYDYGAFLYNLGVRFLPKEFFDKEDMYTHWYAINFGRITSENSGFTVPDGAAPTGIAHAFVEFGWVTPLFWVLIGYWGRLLYSKGMVSTNIRHQAYLTAFFIVMLYLIAQDLYAAFMNMVYLYPAFSIAYRNSVVRMPVQRPLAA